MSEENICKCEHLFYDHGYEKNENPPPHMKSPCKKCECNYFQRPGSQPHVARSIAKTAARQVAEDYQRDLEDQEHLRIHEGRRKYAEIEAKKVEEKEKVSNNFPLTKKVKEKEKDLERIRNEYKIKHGGKPDHFAFNEEWEKKYSAHVLGPLHAGIYYGKTRNREEHDNHRLTQLLYRNKRFKGDPGLTKEEINEICDSMLLVLPHKSPKIIIPIPNIRKVDGTEQTRCALPIAAGLAAMMNGISYNDVVLVRVSRTHHDRSRSGRWSAAVEDYAIADYIKTDENSIIKDQIVLLIDDIKTSGSSTKVCAGLLLDNGAREVIILCAAETYSEKEWMNKTS